MILKSKTKKESISSRIDQTVYDTMVKVAKDPNHKFYDSTIIDSLNIEIDNNNRLEYKSTKYFNLVQQYDHYKGGYVDDILIYSFGTYNTLYEDEFEIEKTKEFSIDIYSGRIGIDEPNEIDKNGFVQPVLNLECPNSRQQYDIFELSLKFKSFGTELLGTHIELEPDNKITKNEIKELMKEIISNEEEQNA